MDRQTLSETCSMLNWHFYHAPNWIVLHTSIECFSNDYRLLLVFSVRTVMTPGSIFDFYVTAASLTLFPLSSLFPPSSSSFLFLLAFLFLPHLPPAPRVGQHLSLYLKLANINQKEKIMSCYNFSDGILLERKRKPSIWDVGFANFFRRFFFCFFFLRVTLHTNAHRTMDYTFACETWI